MIKISALWKHKKDGMIYLKGNVNDRFKLLIFPVKNKVGENGPDYDVFLAPILDSQPTSSFGGDDL